MAFDPSILPHFVAEVQDYMQAEGLPKYVTYCCTNILNYDFTKPDNYIGTMQKYPYNNMYFNAELKRYFPNYHEAESHVQELIAQMFVQPESGFCNCDTKINKLNDDIKKLKEELQRMKELFEKMDNQVRDNYMVLKHRIDNMPVALNNDPNAVEVYIEKANVIISKSLLERALNAESYIVGVETILIDAGLWPVPKHLNWTQLDAKHTDRMTEVFHFFILKLLEKRGLPASMKSKEFKEINTHMRKSFQGRCRDSKLYYNICLKKAKQKENESTNGSETTNDDVPEPNTKRRYRNPETI